MHMADALVSPAVAGGAALVAATLIGVAVSKVKKSKRTDLTALMGVGGAFVFAAQMINFSIPATGSSGHIVGGVLLAAILGPWAAFLTLCSVIVVQCLLFADGGLMALGCNILNMAAASTLFAFPLMFRKMCGKECRPWRIMAASVATSVVALEIGALGVTAETWLSGVTPLSFPVFLGFMLPIHLAIGALEGVATGAVLCFVERNRPATISGGIGAAPDILTAEQSLRRIVVGLLLVTVVMAAGFTWLASSDPDGLEWSLEKVAGAVEFASFESPTAIMPDYDSGFSGIVGSVVVMAMVWAVSSLLFRCAARRAAPEASAPKDRVR